MNHPPLSPEEIRRILDRAAELDDPHQGHLTPQELVEAGVEAGYSRAAMERAVREVREPDQGRPSSEPSPETRPGLRRHLLRHGGMGAATGAFHLFGNWEFSQNLALASLLAGVVYLLVLATLAGAERAHASFQLANLAFWTGFLTLLGVLFPLSLGYYLVAVPLLAAALAVAGVALVEGRWRIAPGRPA